MAELKATLTFDMDAGMESFRALAEDNARLRTLIKDTEHADTHRGDWWCPWCQMRLVSGATDDPLRHTDDCPAFTPTGEVK